VWSEWSAGGLAFGQQAIEKRHAANFASNPGKFSHKLVQVYPGLFGYQQLSADGELKIIE
jgi:hypothetical protein